MWHTPDEQPNCEAGDRIVIIVNERAHANGPLMGRLVILEATETGWFSPDDYYAGYTLGDGVFWAYERDVCQAARTG